MQEASVEAPEIHHFAIGKRFEVRRKMFSLLHLWFRVFDENEVLRYECKMKAFKLKEEFLIQEANSATPILKIKARQMIDFGGFYDVTDLRTGQMIGSLRRHGMASLVRDRWTILNTQGQEIASIEEDSLLLGLIRRTVTTLIPQAYEISQEGLRVGQFRQNFNPFTLKMKAEVSENCYIDERLLVSAVISLMGIDGRQS